MLEGRDEAGLSATRWQPPWGLLGMLGVVLAIESTLAQNDLDFTTPVDWDWRVIGKSASNPDQVKGRDLLFFGDSLVKFSVMPQVLKAMCGRSSFNFALHTGQTSSSYFMLRRTIRAGAKPSAILIDLTPHMLMLPAHVNKHLWGELLTPEECLDLSITMRDADFFASTILRKYLPSYKERLPIRAAIMAATRGQSSSRRNENWFYRRNWQLNDGAQLMSDTPAPTISVDEWSNTLYARWAPNPVNLAYLHRLLDLAQTEKIAVYWLLPPIHPDVQARTDSTGYDASYSKFVAEIVAKFPRTIVIDSRHSGFTADLFIDGAHLNRRGALKLSSALADLLQEVPDRPAPNRWVKLDISHIRPVEVPIEDIVQSSVAVLNNLTSTKR